jgi:hypothetical protein
MVQTEGVLLLYSRVPAFGARVEVREMSPSTVVELICGERAAVSDRDTFAGPVICTTSVIGEAALKFVDDPMFAVKVQSDGSLTMDPLAITSRLTES